MASSPTINPPQTPIAGNLMVSPEWWRYFYQIQRVTAEFTAGTILTPPNSGLQGGGNVAGGLSLSIANNGVTNAMLRQGLSTSVIGRAFGSAGNVADIQAVANNSVLCRQSNQLMFNPSPQVDKITTTDLELTGTPAASTATVTHSIPIEANGTTYYLLLSNAP